MVSKHWTASEGQGAAGSRRASRCKIGVRTCGFAALRDNPLGTGYAEKSLTHHAARITAVMLLVLWTANARAAIPTSAFDAANKLYEQAKYSEAARAYEKLTETSQASAAVYFNLGNAFFKSGQIGRALAAYHQAEQIAPRDPDLRANLQFARNQVQGPAFVPNRWQRGLDKLTLNEWTVLAAATVWVLLLLLTTVQWRPTLKRSLRGFLATVAVAAGFSCVCLATAFIQQRFGRTAIVIAQDAMVRHGPLEESQNAFTVHDGAELRVLDQKDEWLQVSTDPSRIGWLRRDQVVLAP